MRSLEIILRFIEENSKYAISESVIRKLEKNSQNDINDTIDYRDGITYIYNVLSDTFMLNSEEVKVISNKLARCNCKVGRQEKNQIKYILDYKLTDSLNQFLDSLQLDMNNLLDLKCFINENIKDKSEIAKVRFVQKWDEANNCNDTKTQYALIQGIYSRLVPFFNSNKVSLNDIYNENLIYIKKELSQTGINLLEKRCLSSVKEDAGVTRRKFYEIYLSILDKEIIDLSKKNLLDSFMNQNISINSAFYNLETESVGHFIFKIDQKLFDKCSSEEEFYDTVLGTIQQCYRVLKNHRTLAIVIENIFSNGKNIKWLLYSYIGIYAEHFIPTKECRNFYKPEELFYAYSSYYGQHLDDKQKIALKDYYKGKISKDELINNYNINQILLEFDFENVWYGFTFVDCISITCGSFQQNSEIHGIENTNELLFIFNKYRHDDRKIPCPECSSLNISGNSFPEVGHRSWECKNPCCPSRSKSNRGKRYSLKSNFMQFAYENNNDIIEKDLIRKWRRDIVEATSSETIEMLIKYFSFTSDTVLMVNFDSVISNELYGRNIKVVHELSFNEMYKGIFKDYFNSGKYVSRYLNITSNKVKEKRQGSYDKYNQTTLICGDSNYVLRNIKDSLFAAAVTSPPYYNARAYSQWPNLYLYLADMYSIIKEAYRTIKPGGVFLYNIGDICGNENTIVSSTMGNKRILLGAYAINLFLSAGFELVDNILWDKGEPQSNRQKNDGKFTPFYQKPMNVYEHMFIFKKTSNTHITFNSDNINQQWSKNIVQISPVIKINSKGENTLGHTAPFPIDIPDYVCQLFTQKGDFILEPFAGSGTSIYSSINNDRNCIAIELSREYFNLITDICSEKGIEINFVY